jgi:hypothetical protein
VQRRQREDVCCSQQVGDIIARRVLNEEYGFWSLRGELSDLIGFGLSRSCDDEESTAIVNAVPPKEFLDQIIHPLVCSLERAHGENDECIFWESKPLPCGDLVAGAKASYIHEVGYGKDFLLKWLISAPSFEIVRSKMLKKRVFPEGRTLFFRAMGQDDTRARKMESMQVFENETNPWILNVKNVVSGPDIWPEIQSEGRLFDFVARSKSIAPTSELS